jgi:hypothetical protein
MDDDRQFDGTQLADQPVHASDMLKVAVAQDHRLDIPGRELEPPHVLHQPIRGDSSVEQQSVLPPTAHDAHQRREAVFGTQRVERFAQVEHRCRHPRFRADHRVSRWTIVDQQHVDHVVHQHRDRQCINRLKCDLLDLGHRETGSSAAPMARGALSRWRASLRARRSSSIEGPTRQEGH